MFFRFRQKKYRMQFKKSFFLFCLFFFILSLVLGVWQIKRFEFKKNIIDTYQNRLNEIPTPFMFVSNSGNSQFQSISVEGEYLNELTFFIQDRIYKGESGFEVFTPLRIKNNDKLLLVDRGWIKKSKHQTLDLPQIKDKQSIVGYIKYVDEYQFILGNNILAPEKKPLMMQKLDIKELSRITDRMFYPYVLRLDPAMENGFVRDWVISVTPPERHRMYAIQWFALAIVLIIAYIGFCTEVVRESDENTSSKNI